MLRALSIFALFLLTPVLASEPLPNQASVDTGTPQHGPGKSMSGVELESLYLQSPRLVSNGVEKNGMGAVIDENLYLNNEDPRQRQRQEQQNIPRANAAPPPPPEPTGNAMSLLPLLPLMGGQR